MDFRNLGQMGDTDESILDAPYRPFYNILASKPVLVKQDNDYDRKVFKERPLLGVLLFDNVASEARDIAANERSIFLMTRPSSFLTVTAFLSWLKLSVYMSIVAVAVVLNFHLKSKPSTLEKKWSLPLGIIFWLLSLACLLSGVANYISTVSGYSHRQALVQTGWKTQTVFTVVAAAIVATCVLLLSTNAQNR